MLLVVGGGGGASGSRSQGLYDHSVTDILWTIDSFASKLSVLVDRHKPKCTVKTRLLCSRSVTANVQIFSCLSGRSSSELLNLLYPTWYGGA